jgi:protein-S-isoprenylcysteine O-methyltransferase Ste14
MPPQASLKSRLLIRELRIQVFLAVVIFGAARSVKFWQGWAYLGTSLALHLWFGVYFYRRDPAVLERRLLHRETIGWQKRLMSGLLIVVAAIYALSGCDHRWAWSRVHLVAVPTWLAVEALALVVWANLLTFQVIQANRFAASVIQLETSQTLATGGPYRLVRHPMYLAMILHWLATPVALGSFLALAAAVFTVPIFVLRLLNEEKLLRRDLPGYADYCRQTRRRLVPGIW